MERRDFLKFTGMGAVAFAIGAPLASCTGDKRGGLPQNWIWLHGNNKKSDAEWLEHLTGLKDNGIEGVLVNGGNELYARLAPLCKQAGVELHCWRWTMNRGGHMKDHPEWYAVSRNGDSVVDKPPYVDYYRWLCPSHKEVKDLIVKDYSTLCDIEGVSGVHLDYVRFCDVILPLGLQPKYGLVQDHEMPEYDFCYCEKCRSGFKAKHGYDPLDLEDPSKDAKWHRYRLDLVVDIVQAIVEEVHRKGKVITGAVFPTPEMSRRMVRQDWAKFNLDAYFPMIYHQFYNEDVTWVGKCVAEGVKELPKNQHIYAGIFSEGGMSPEEVYQAYKQAVTNGAKGVSFFSSNLKAEQWKKLQEAVKDFG